MIRQKLKRRSGSPRSLTCLWNTKALWAFPWRWRSWEHWIIIPTRWICSINWSRRNLVQRRDNGFVLRFWQSRKDYDSRGCSKGHTDQAHGSNGIRRMMLQVSRGCSILIDIAHHYVRGVRLPHEILSHEGLFVYNLSRFHFILCVPSCTQFKCPD